MPGSIRKILPSVCLLLLSLIAEAQLPTYGDKKIYLLDNSGKIYNYDPALPVSSSNPVLNTITAPSQSNGLAVSHCLNPVSSSLTFYVSNGSNYYYYTGGTWVNTNHNIGTFAAANIGGGGGYIYGLVGASGDIYKYDGNGNATLAFTLSNLANVFVFDLFGDCMGNFYALTLGQGVQQLRKFNPSGAVLQSWTVSGISSPSSQGGGLAIFGNKLYFSSTQGIWEGVIGTTNVSFSLLTTQLTSYIDFGSAPIATTIPNVVTASLDTGYYCGYGPGISLAASGPGPYTWTVLNGNVTISGSNSPVTVTATNNATIVLSNQPNSGCPAADADTIFVTVPTATITTDADFVIAGCKNNFQDTLHATITNTTPWVSYQPYWTPAASIVGNANVYDPIINPQSKTTYKVSISTPAWQGGCEWRDSVTVDIKEIKVTSAFSHSLKYGCAQDTLVLYNSSTSSYGALNYFWNFGDGNTDNSISPWHVYKQGRYNVVLVSSVGGCYDTSSKEVDILHPLRAIIKPIDTIICKGATLTFDGSQSIISLKPGSYKWTMGDGKNSTGTTITHKYGSAGIHTATLFVADSLKCTDSTFINIYNTLSIPQIELGQDTTLCTANKLVLPFSNANDISEYLWSNGDTSATITITDIGKYVVIASNKCGSVSDSILVTRNCYVWFPNAFTPNNDGKNDIARLTGNLAGVTDYTLRIYNRWGQLMFETSDPSNGWNGWFKGLLQPIGSYYYLLRFKYLGNSEQLKGDITLIL